MTQTIDLTRFGAAKAGDRKGLAFMAYESAKEDSNVANWEAVADMLRACLPATATRAPSSPVWWRDYAVKGFAALKKAQKEMVEFEFADGRIVRSAALSLPTKGFNIGRAARMAIAFYRVRDGQGVPVPEFVRISGPESYSTDVVNTLTESLRAQGGGLDDVAKGVEDLDSRIAAVEAEIERRKGRRELNAILGALAIRTKEPGDYESDSVDTIKQAMAALDSEWSAAIAAGERELATLRATLPVVEPEPESELEPVADSLDDVSTVAIAPPLQFAASMATVAVSYSWGAQL